MKICKFARKNARLVDIQEELSKKEVNIPKESVPITLSTLTQRCVCMRQ